MPGRMLADATDVCQIEELVRLGELTKRAWEKDVQVMVEGPGHMPMDQIAANMKVQQSICQGCSLLCAGPSGDGHCAGLMTYHFRDRGSHRRRFRRCVPVLRNAGGAPGPSQCRGCKAGDHRLQDCGPCGRYRKRRAGRKRIDDQMADARKALDWSAVGLLH